MKNVSNPLSGVFKLNPITILKTLLKYGFIVVAIVRGLEVIIQNLKQFEENETIDKKD